MSGRIIPTIFGKEVSRNWATAHSLVFCLWVCHLASDWRSRFQFSSVTQSCLTLCNPMDCSLPGSSVHRVFQARMLEWAAFSFSRGSSRPRDCPCIFYIGRKVLFHWAIREAKGALLLLLLSHFSHVQLCAIPETAAHQVPQSLGFSRQEHWSGLPFPSPMHESEK